MKELWAEGKEQCNDCGAIVEPKEISTHLMTCRHTGIKEPRTEQKSKKLLCPRCGFETKDVKKWKGHFISSRHIWSKNRF